MIKASHYLLCTKNCVREKTHFLNLIFCNQLIQAIKFSEFIALIQTITHSPVTLLAISYHNLALVMAFNST